jgi:hypothetical protein
VIALGRPAAVTLARTYLGEGARNLAALVGREEPFRVGGAEALLLFAYHPSGARRHATKAKPSFDHVADAAARVLAP